ncbi:hypothetical protein F4821DRAFT_244155 [Hypoxylon rubiginosum]|uniref:Uncharacterized protein n=1 Tax=Hypoxylon rubiginosum TaxID=110542 RepID=A0ACC0CTM6_9PEZI|nr:hypothetical protein F4821DRAFT_244155 [Hypoxylon rubiginosum]
MKSIQLLFSAALFASISMATPIANESPEALLPRELEERQTASGCNYYAAPRCCVPTICQCANGAIYQLNQDNLNRGLHGCDPPWGYLGASSGQFPGYCC